MTTTDQKRRVVLSDVQRRYGTIVRTRIDVAQGPTAPSNPAGVRREFSEVVEEALGPPFGAVGPSPDDESSYVAAFGGEGHVNRGLAQALALHKRLQALKKRVDGRVDVSVAVCTGDFTEKMGRKGSLVLQGDPVDQSAELLDPRAGLVLDDATFKAAGAAQRNFDTVDEPSDDEGVPSVVYYTFRG